MKKIISVFMCFALVLIFSSCSANELKNENNNATTDSVTEENETQLSASDIAAENGFVPFTCSEEDDFSVFCIKGDVSYSVDTKTNLLIKAKDCSEQSVAVFNDTVKSCIMVGNAVYIDCENGLYRLPVDDNGECDTENLSVVLNEVSGVPVYCLENKMAVRVHGAQDDSYVLLNTQTGEYEATYDFNNYLSSDDSPAGLISSDKAGSVAVSEIQSDIYKQYRGGDNYSEVSGITLVHYPDFYYGNSDTVWEYGKHSEYSYMVEIVADGADIAPKFTVFVNAYNSEIQFISFRKS